MIINPFVSVIIPTFNDGKRLENCLLSLCSQNYPANQYEILVVDNNSTDQTRNITERFIQDRKGNPLIKYVLECRQGASFARNAGISLAASDFILFTDADCVCDSNWIRELGTLLSQPEVDAVQGRIVLGTATPADCILPEDFIRSRFAHVDYGENVFLMGKEFDMVSANMGVRRGIFSDHGNFDGAFPKNQDTELSRRFYAFGVRRYYCPNAVVHHYFDPKRLTEKLILKQSYYWGRSEVLMGDVKIQPARYLFFFLRKMIGLGVQVLLTNDRTKRFLLKCSISSIWGRCHQVLINARRA